jgi:EAL domain-containing protein (putative c-di-GMP-specific phosphodiesterase class I)
VRVARRLNIRTVAEHVHNQDTLDRLTDIGVDHIQGDWIGRAAPLEQLFSAPARRATPSSA